MSLVNSKVEITTTIENQLHDLDPAKQWRLDYHDWILDCMKQINLEEEQDE